MTSEWNPTYLEKLGVRELVSIYKSGKMCKNDTKIGKNGQI